MSNWLDKLIADLSTPPPKPRAEEHVVYAVDTVAAPSAPPKGSDATLTLIDKAGVEGVDIWTASYAYTDAQKARKRNDKTRLIDGGYGLYFDPALSVVGALLDVTIDGRLFPRVRPGWHYVGRFDVAQVSPNVRCDPWAQYGLIAYRHKHPAFPAYRHPNPWKGFCGSPHASANHVGASSDVPGDSTTLFSGYYFDVTQKYNSIGGNSPRLNRGAWGAPIGPQGKCILTIMSRYDRIGLSYPLTGLVRVWHGLQPDWDWRIADYGAQQYFPTQNATGWRVWGNIDLTTLAVMTCQIPSKAAVESGGLVEGSRIFPEIYQLTTPDADGFIYAFVESW